MEKLRKDIPEKYKWDLTKIIKNDEEYQSLVAEINVLADKVFLSKGSITSSSDSLFCYLETMGSLNEKLEKLYVYSLLYHYQDMSNEFGLKYKNIAEKLVDDIAVKLSFAEVELMKSGYDTIKTFIASDERLKKYAFYLEKLFRYESHTLSEKEERLIALAHKAFGTPDDAYSAIDNVDIDLGYIKDENAKKVKLTQSNYIKYMTSPKRSVRKNAFQNMYKYYIHHINTITSLYNGCIKEDYFSNVVRGFSSPLEQSLYADNISVEFYNSFIEEVHKYLPLMYKYMRLRNKLLGFKSHMYDVYVDLVENKNQKEVSYDEAKEHVKNALKPLGNTYLEDLNKAFDNAWIDILPNKYKRSGAYQWGCFGVDPYVSINFEGDIDNVSTLAHELGHAMHSYYSNKYQDYTYANYPIFLAEIASTVNEVLLDDYFYKNAKSDEEKIVFLQNFLDKVRTTIFRQTMFAEFETKMHDYYAKGEAITSELACNTYYDLNKLYFGKSIVIDEQIKYEWARIPHFYTPFYVYKYATGLVSALSIASDILNNVDGAQEHYLEFLRSGASDYPLNILKKANVDITDKKTIYKAFSLFEEKLNQLEELIERRVDDNE